MSETPTREELRGLLHENPDDVLRQYQDRLRELRDDEDNPRIRAIITAVLDQYENENAGV